MLFILVVLLIIGAVVFRVKAAADNEPGLATGGTVAAVALALIAIMLCFTYVPAGNVGVIDFFGSVSDQTLSAGISPVNPMATVEKFSIKTEEIKETMEVPSKEGLTVTLEVSALYHLDPSKAAQVYKTIGPNYVQIILEPQMRSVSRGVTALYDAKALYTSEREAVSQVLFTDLEKLVGPRGIIIESTPLRSVTLPQGLKASIEEKLRAEQESQRMQFVLTKEKQEADRKRIEAQGIQDFQTIVARGISDQLLEWKGIEATEKLAVSPNAKIVIIGSGKNGLPVILDTK